MDFIYKDKSIVVCLKPPGVLSTDEPGGLPELVRNALGDQQACVRTVHRLDRVVSGLMVLARTPEAASALSAQIRERSFGKDYLAVVHGVPPEEKGSFFDLLLRSKAERKTYVVHHSERGVQEALLDYETLATVGDLSLVHIHLHTGRTHQIRAQFSSRGLPLAGDRKYSTLNDDCPIALWSRALEFDHPRSGRAMRFSAPPPDIYPWNCFENAVFPR